MHTKNQNLYLIRNFNPHIHITRSKISTCRLLLFYGCRLCWFVKIL